MTAFLPQDSQGEYRCPSAVVSGGQWSREDSKVERTEESATRERNCQQKRNNFSLPRTSGLADSKSPAARTDNHSRAAPFDTPRGVRAVIIHHVVGVTGFLSSPLWPCSRTAPTMLNFSCFNTILSSASPGSACTRP